MARLVRRYEYRRLDVFTREPFGGNPLAVFLDQADLETATMQRIAREMNLSETVFVQRTATSPSEWRVRFFTPAVELPFAGHPTVGTAVALFQEGMLVARNGAAEVILHEGVGPVRATVARSEDGRTSATFLVPKLPQFGRADVPPDVLARMLGLEVGDLMDGPWQPRTISCGVPFYFVAVRTLEAIRRVRIRKDVWEEHLSHNWAPHLYVLCPEVEQAASTVHARMFPPAMGVDEDPATGGAVAALSGFLAASLGRGDGTFSWRVEQGFELGRPSLIDLEVDVRGGDVAAVRLGGSVVPMGSGFLELPG